MQRGTSYEFFSKIWLSVKITSCSFVIEIQTGVAQGLTIPQRLYSQEMFCSPKVNSYRGRGGCFEGSCNPFLCSSDVHSQEPSDLHHGSGSEQQLVVLQVLNISCKQSAAEEHASIFHITK